MDILKKIDTISSHSNAEKGILTATIGFADKNVPHKREFQKAFNSLLKTKVSESEKKLFKIEILKIEKYLQENLDTHGTRSIAFFVSDGFFNVLTFEFPLPLDITISQTPDVEQIQHAIYKHKRYIVLLVDRKKTRMFSVYLGEIEDHKDIVIDIVPQNVKVEEEHFYGRSNKIARHIQDHLRRHLKLVVSELIQFSKGKDYSFLLIGGHKEMFNEIQKILPKSYREKIAGEFVTELNIPINEVFLKSKKVAEKIDWDREYQKMIRSIAGL